MNPNQKTKKILFWLGLSLPMVALLVMTWLVHQSSGQFNNSFNWVMQTYKVLDLYEQTQSHVVDAEANQRGFLLTGRQEYLEPYQTAMGLVRDDLAQLKRLTTSRPSQQANLAVLEKLVNDHLVFDPATVAGQMPSGESVANLTKQGRQKVESIRQVVTRSQSEFQADLSQRQQAAEANLASSQFMSLVLIAVVGLALLLVVVTLLRLEKLQAFVTVCAWTGQVKYQGQWLQLDDYLKRQFGIAVSHSMSEQAAAKMTREVEDLNRKHPPSAG